MIPQTQQIGSDAACRESYWAGQLEGTVIGNLIRECDMDASLAPHVMLAVMWAALANTVPAAFWSVAFLLLPENEQHRQRALESLPTKPDTQAYVQVTKATLCAL